MWQPWQHDGEPQDGDLVSSQCHAVHETETEFDRPFLTLTKALSWPQTRWEPWILVYWLSNTRCSVSSWRSLRYGVLSKVCGRERDTVTPLPGRDSADFDSRWRDGSGRIRICWPHFCRAGGSDDTTSLYVSLFPDSRVGVCSQAPPTYVVNVNWK